METISPVVQAEVPESDNIMMMVGMGGTNSANMRVRLSDRRDRKRSQQEIAAALSRY
ncbi:MAG: hypothetical protein R2758_13360 [Bacteroidales bacterium]